MKACSLFRPAVVLAALLGLSVALRAQPPEPPAPTLWRFLGIPQNFQKIRDAVLNRKGKHPKWEAKPPLKALADPANLQSPNPAIKAAAQIKAEEDLKDQKIKAIKYLATVGCGCHEGVKEALLAALFDCTEEVRYQAAIAFCQASGNPCTACNPGSCCDPDVMETLKDVAFGQEANGCYKETSPRVRAAARNALNACQRVVPAPARKEVPVEGLPKELGPPLIEEPALEEETKNLPLASSEGETAMIVNPVSLAHVGEAADTVEADSEDGCCGSDWLAGCDVGCGRWPRGRRPCRRYPAGKPAPGPEEAFKPVPPGEEAPAPEAPYYPPPTALAGTFGAAAGPQPLVPNMIGDLFGNVSTQSTVVQSFSFTNLGANWIDNRFFYTLRDGTRVALNDSNTPPGWTESTVIDYNDASGRLGGAPLADVPAGGTLAGGLTTVFGEGEYNTQFDVAYAITIPNPGAGGVVGKMKIAENTSPLPRDRLIFDFSHFNNVPIFLGGVDVNRFTVGFEKTFLDGLASFELKAPMAVTLNSTITQDGVDFSHGEFGNLGLTVKGLLLQRRTWAVSGGVMVTVPTADDTRLISADGTPWVEIRNESVHVGPFFGFLWTPNDRLFAQAFLQYDVDANGNPVYINQGNGLMEAGRLDDATFQYFDVGIGSWVYRSRDRRAHLQRAAWTAEIHWNRALQDTDYLRAGNFLVGDRLTDVEVFNVVLGAHFDLARDTTVSFGYATPIGGGQDQEFDGELRLMINRWYGRSSRFRQVPL